MKKTRAKGYVHLGQMLLGIALVSVLQVGAGAQEAASGSPEPGCEAKWKNAVVLLQRADREAVAAIEVVLKDVAGSFDQVDANIRPFVQDLLSFDGEIKFAAAGTKKALNFGAGLLDTAFGTKLAQSSEPEDFRAYVRSTFVSRVLDPAVFKRGVLAAVEAYRAKLEAIEGKLLVELEADVPDSTFRLPRIAEPRLEEALLTSIDQAVDTSVTVAGTDFAVVSGKAAVSWFGGNWLSSALVGGVMAKGVTDVASNSDPVTAVSGLTVAAVGVASGIVLDMALDKAAALAGHDPVGDLAGKLQQRMKQARKCVLEGDDLERSLRYGWFVFLREGHPDPKIRDTCALAAAAMERKYFVGLKPTLEAIQLDRYCTQRRSVYQAIYGEGVTPPANLCLSPQATTKAAEALVWAKNYINP